MRASELFVAKHLSKIIGVRTGAEAVQTRTDGGQGGERSIFRDFVQTSFMNGP